MSSVIFQIQSYVIISIIFYGIYHRRNRFKHMRIMKAAIIWDLLLVAQIEINRSAIDKASKIVSNPTILNIHVSLAVSTVLLYGFVWYFGQKLHNGEEKVRKWHRLSAGLALTTRLSTLITSHMI